MSETRRSLLKRFKNYQKRLIKNSMCPIETGKVSFALKCSYCSHSSTSQTQLHLRKREIVLPDVCRELYYLPSVVDKALAGHVIRTVKVNNGNQCEIRCYHELECLSYNLGPYQDNGHACELSKSDHIRHPGDLVPMPGFIYTGTEVHDLIDFTCSSV